MNVACRNGGLDSRTCSCTEGDSGQPYMKRGITFSANADGALYQSLGSLLVQRFQQAPRR